MHFTANGRKLGGFTFHKYNIYEQTKSSRHKIRKFHICFCVSMQIFVTMIECMVSEHMQSVRAIAVCGRIFSFLLLLSDNEIQAVQVDRVCNNEK